MTFLGSSCISELCTVRDELCSEQCPVWFFPSTGIYIYWANASPRWQSQWPYKDHRSECENLSTTLISCCCHRPLLSTLGLCSPNVGLVLHSCPPLITQLRSPEEVVQDAFVNTPSQNHLGLLCYCKLTSELLNHDMGVRKMLFMLYKQAPLPLIVSCLCHNGITDFCPSSTCTASLDEAGWALLIWARIKYMYRHNQDLILACCKTALLNRHCLDSSPWNTIWNQFLRDLPTKSEPQGNFSDDTLHIWKVGLPHRGHICPAKTVCYSA